MIKLKNCLYLCLALPLCFQHSVQAQHGHAATGQAKKTISGNSRVQVYTTARETNLRLTPTDTLQFTHFAQPLETEPCVFIDPAKTFQSVIGIGGALTDAAAETFAKLPKTTQQELLTAYYHPGKGIGYTLGRTQINSCDFSSDSYTYVADNDTALRTFSVTHDEQYRIPLIKQAIAAAGGQLTLFVSPWTPPAWMKDNNDLLHGGKLKPAFRQSWANYYVQFIRAYEKRGIPIWALSVQNEPMAKQRWESCLYTAEEERDFIKYYLGPTLHKNGYASKKIIAWDHNRDLVFQRASVLLQDKEAAKYIWGIGFHWYETWTGSGMQFDNVQRVAEAYPAFSLLFTEGSIEKYKREQLQEWWLGERYGNSLVHDFNCGARAWCDWNILLDENGGPNHVQNYCFAPIQADTQTGQLIYTNAYYYLGHFSKFVRPGAKRIAAASSRDKLQTTAFVNTDGKIAVIVMNTSDEKIPYHVWVQGKAVATTSLPHSIATLVIQ
jgi:glucosylceramidase